MAQKKSWFNMALARGGVGEIHIFDEIGGFGVTSESFHVELSKLKAQGVKTLVIAVDSPGGDVTTGWAIHSMLSRFPAKKIARVEGIAASMASVIIMAADEIVMPVNAMLMVHNPWGGVNGSAEQIASFADALEIMKINIRNAYAKRTGLDIEKVQRLMDAETWMSAQRAVELGFADRVEEPLKMAALVNSRRFDLSGFKNAPKLGGVETLHEAVFRKFNQQKGGRHVRRP